MKGGLKELMTAWTEQVTEKMHGKENGVKLDEENK